MRGMRGVGALEEVHRAKDYHPMNVGVAKGGSSRNSAPWDPAFHHRGVRVSLIRRGHVNVTGLVGSWKPSYPCKKRERGGGSHVHAKVDALQQLPPFPDKNGRFTDSGIWGLPVCNGKAYKTQHGRTTDRP